MPAGPRRARTLIHASVLRDPATMRFPNVERWPDGLHGFEDLAFLFSSNQLNHGVASLQIDEAALLYRLGRNATTGPIAEIGRFKGGSTFIFASAMPDGVELWSYDFHVALRPDMPGEQLDAELREALDRYGLAHKVHLRRRRLAHRGRRRTARSRSCSSTATIPTRARRPISSGGAPSFGAAAATCSSTTRSTAAATGTSTPASRG